MTPLLISRQHLMVSLDWSDFWSSSDCTKEPRRYFVWTNDQTSLVFFFLLPFFIFLWLSSCSRTPKSSLLAEAERAIRHWELNMVKQEGSSQSQLRKSIRSLRKSRWIKLLWNIPWSHEEEYLKPATKSSRWWSTRQNHCIFPWSFRDNLVESKAKKGKKKKLMIFFLGLRDFKPPQRDKKFYFDS